MLVCDWVSRIVYLRTEVRVLVVKIPQNSSAVNFTITVTDHYHSLIHLFHVQMKFILYKSNFKIIY